MSQRDVSQPTSAEEALALVQQGLDAFSRGDLDAAIEYMHPEIEWHAAFRLPDMPPGKTTYHGRNEVRQLWATLRSAWETLTLTIEEVIYAHEELVIVRARFIGRSTSGIEADRMFVYLFELSGPQLKRLRPFETAEEALAAARAAA